MKLCTVQIKAYVLSLSDQMQQPILMRLEFLVVLLLKIQIFVEVRFCFCANTSRRFEEFGHFNVKTNVVRN